MVDDDDILVGPKPITLSQDELDAFVRELGGSNKAIPILAQEVAAALEEQQPEYFTGGYARLRNGTSTVFDLLNLIGEETPL